MKQLRRQLFWTSDKKTEFNADCKKRTASKYINILCQLELKIMLLTLIKFFFQLYVSGINIGLMKSMKFLIIWSEGSLFNNYYTKV